MAEIITEHLSIDTLEGDIRQIFEYWQSLKGDRLGPSWRQFDLMKLPTRRIPFTIITDIVDAERGVMSYRFVGTDFRRVHGIELTGKSPLDVPPADLGRRLYDDLIDIVKQQKPTFSQHQLAGIKVLEILQRVIRLPLSDDSQQVSHIVSVVDYVEDRNDVENFLSIGSTADIYEPNTS